MPVERARDDPSRVVLEPDGRARRAEQGGRQLDDAGEDLVERQRGGELTAELEQRRRALGLAARRVVEAGVLDRDRGVAREHLEQADVVLVELVEAQLRHDDHADDVRAVPEGHGNERFLDHGRALDAMAELAVGGVADEQRLAALGALPGHAAADLDAEQLEGQGARLGAERAAERDWHELVAVDDEHPAVVVVDRATEARVRSRRRSCARR